MFLVYTILISVILASCTQGDRPNDVPFTATATKSISVSSATASQTLTPLDTPEVTSSPVLGPNSAPTLESEVAFRILHDYLKNTRPCLLPCWWGISAGASTLPDVQKQLSEFSGIATRVYFGPAGNSWIVGNLDINFDEGDSVIGVRTSYLISSGNSEIVSFVGIDTVSLPQNNNGRVYGDKTTTNFCLRIHYLKLCQFMAFLRRHLSQLKSMKPSQPPLITL
jgi:hypothetical protein